MKNTLMLVIASTTLTAAIGVPAWSALRLRADGGPLAFAALIEDGSQAHPVVLASIGDDDDGRWREGSRRGHDYDDDDDDDDDDKCDDDHNCRGGVASPTPAGTVAPPQNGLFGNGAPPQVQVN